MPTGQRWAAGFLGMFGALIWGLGTVMHIQAVSVPVWLSVLWWAGGDDPRGGLDALTWLLWVPYHLIGPVLVAVGGGLRFLAGIISGRKVGGDLIRGILWWHWLRYEAVAAGVAMILASFFFLASAAGGPGGMASTILGWLGVAVAYVAGGIYLSSRFGACRERSDRLMWQVRQQGVADGTVRAPADAMIPQRARLTGEGS